MRRRSFERKELLHEGDIFVLTAGMKFEASIDGKTLLEESEEEFLYGRYFIVTHAGIEKGEMDKDGPWPDSWRVEAQMLPLNFSKTSKRKGEQHVVLHLPEEKVCIKFTQFSSGYLDSNDKPIMPMFRAKRAYILN